MYEFSQLNNRIYINLNSTLDVLWHLVAHYKSNHIGSISPSLGNNKNQPMKITREVICKKLGKSRDTIRLPAQGSLALVVHQGYKIFNYGDRTVSKAFDSSVSTESIAKELATVKSASRLDFAPRFITEDMQIKVFTEELVAGQLAAFNAGTTAGFAVNLFNSHVAGYLARMINTDQQQGIQIGAILRELSGFTEYDSYSDLESTYPALIKIREYFQAVCDELGNVASDTVIKCYSHGDFSLENIITGQNTVKVIDWEGAESRSILNDFYNYFFTEMYYERLDISAETITSAIRKLLDLLESTALQESIRTRHDIYRKLFYLERIKVCLERKITSSLVDVTLNSIRLFKAYDSLS